MDRSKKVVNDLLTDVFNQILILEERNLTEHDAIDVTMTEIHVIEAIRKCEPPTMGNVSKRLMITMGTLTTSVNRLVEKGYVIRTRFDGKHRFVKSALSQTTTLPCHERQPSHVRTNKDTIHSNCYFIYDTFLRF